MPESLYLIEASKIVESILVNDLDNVIVKTGPALIKFQGKNFSILRTWLHKIDPQYRASRQSKLSLEEVSYE